MNYDKYLLIKLAEECNEIAQAAIKVALFGPKSVDPREDTGETNSQKLGKELMDFSAVLNELNRNGPFLDADYDEEYVLKKCEKLKQYYDVAKEELCTNSLM